MSPSVERWRTARTIKQRLEHLTAIHPGTWAAFARGHIAWKGWGCIEGGKAPQLPQPIIAIDLRGNPVDPAVEIPAGHVANPLRAKLVHAYTKADLRARGECGYDNRHARKRKAREIIASMRTIAPHNAWSSTQGYRGVMK